MSLRSSRDDGPVTPKPNNIETKSLEYEVEILDVQFNHTGRYFVKMTIQSLHTRDYSKVRLSAVHSSEIRRHKNVRYYSYHYVSWFGLAIRRYRLVSGRTSVRFRFGFPLSSKRLWLSLIHI